MIYLVGEVTPDMYLSMVKKLDKKTGKVTVTLSSEGGDLMAGLAIYDRLRSRDCTIIATGENSSAATIILQAAKIRKATPNTHFLFHKTRIEYQDWPEGMKPTKEDTDEDNFLKKYCDDIMFGVYSTRISCDNIREAYGRKCFGVSIALKLGIIDEICGKNDFRKLY
jgi:ATP-dependent protease ClpP protease subunit